MIPNENLQSNSEGSCYIPSREQAVILISRLRQTQQQNNIFETSPQTFVKYDENSLCFLGHLNGTERFLRSNAFISPLPTLLTFRLLWHH